MWTECPSDCSTLEYCRSGSAELGPTSPALVARPSRCSGDECGNDCDPRDPARGPPSKPSDSRLPGGFALAGGNGGGMPCLGETDCERRRSASLGMNLDISCLSCSCPTSRFRIFFNSSSPLDSIPAGVLTATDACSPSNRPGRRFPSLLPQRRLLRARKAGPFSVPEADSTPNGAKTAGLTLLRISSSDFPDTNWLNRGKNTIFSGEQFVGCARGGGGANCCRIYLSRKSPTHIQMETE
jgi:hypothetical protein